MTRDELIVFDDLPENRPDWDLWFRKHGIDPNDVIIRIDGTPGWVKRRESAYQVVYLAPAMTDDGRLAGPGHTVERVVQLEGPPLPFPDAVGVWTTRRLDQS